MPPIFPTTRGEFDDFLGGREITGHVEQSGGKSEGAVAHGLRGELLHLADLRIGGRTVGEPDDCLPYAALPDEGREVDGDGHLPNAVEERRDGQGRTAVGAFHDGGDAFTQIVFRRGNGSDSASPVRVNVDEPGGHHQALSVDAHASGRVAQSAYRGDGVAANPDIRKKPRGAGPIHHAGSGNNDVVGRGLTPQSRCHHQHHSASHHAPYCTFGNRAVYQAILAGKNSEISSS